MSDCRKCAEFDWCVENEDCGMFKPKPQINADRIRAMTDEELAEYLCRVENADSYVFDWLYWLKQEVTDEQ